MAMKDFVTKRMSKNYKFMGDDLKIYKLSVSDVEEIQAAASTMEGATDDSNSLAVLRLVIEKGTDGGADISMDEFKALPMDELAALSTAIMAYSGLGTQAVKQSGYLGAGLRSTTQPTTSELHFMRQI